jgi:ERCC4-type nuclease
MGEIPVFVDNREPNSLIIKGKTLFPNLHVLTLPVFDVIIGNARIGIERKTNKDLLSSIIDKRFENQCVKMAEYANTYGTHCYFFLQGGYTEITEDPYFWWVTPKIWCGILASINEHKDMRIIPYDNNHLFWVQVERLIYKYNEKKPLQHINIDSNNMSLTARMISQISNVGPVRAEAVAERYTIKELCEIDQKSLLGIDGIGKKYAEKIITAFQEVS